MSITLNEAIDPREEPVLNEAREVGDVRVVLKEMNEIGVNDSEVCEVKKHERKSKHDVCMEGKSWCVFSMKL